MKLRILNLRQAFHDQDLYSLNELDNWMHDKTVFSCFSFGFIVNNGFIPVDVNIYNKEELREEIGLAWADLAESLDIIKKAAH